MSVRPALPASDPPTTISDVEVSFITPVAGVNTAVTFGSAVLMAAASSVPVIPSVTATLLPLIVILSVAARLEVPPVFRLSTAELVAVAPAAVVAGRPLLAKSVPPTAISFAEVSTITPVVLLNFAVTVESAVLMAAASSVPFIPSVKATLLPLIVILSSAVIVEAPPPVVNVRSATPVAVAIAALVVVVAVPVSTEPTAVAERFCIAAPPTVASL